MNSAARLLLLSTSTVHGGDYLQYAEAEVRDFFQGFTRVLFVPFALHDHAAYAGRVRKRFAALQLTLDSLHEAPQPAQAVREAEAIFIGGGNTFRLLHALQQKELLEPIRARVAEGLPYMGSSAGSNVAAPTIKTTNDMPIIQPASFDALALVPFQLNPHYLDADPHSTHMGETREERLLQYLEENEAPVIGLREGAWLRIDGGKCVLKGDAGARLFRRKLPPLELSAGNIDRFL